MRELTIIEVQMVNGNGLMAWIQGAWRAIVEILGAIADALTINETVNGPEDDNGTIRMKVSGVRLADGTVICGEGGMYVTNDATWCPPAP